MLFRSIDYLLASSNFSVTSSNGFSSSSFSATYNFPLLWLGPEFDYALADFGALRLRGQVGAGYTMLMGAGSSFSTSGSLGTLSGSSTDTGSGFGLKLGAGADYAFGPHCSVGLDLGYRLASIATVTDKSSSGTSTTLKKADGSNLPLDYSGVHSRLSVNWVF